ncbi:Arginyl-tRNA synthetase [Mortierella sp. GBA30]|nr:Arginyl-tRNA synthetase [Mortierella sp. GBA30]
MTTTEVCSRKESVLASFRRVIASHLSSVLGKPVDSLIPLVQQNTGHRKPSHSVFSVVIKRLGRGLKEEILQQCVVLSDESKEFISRARRTKDMLLYDPVSLRLIQLSLGRIHDDITHSDKVGYSQERIQSHDGSNTSNNGSKRDRQGQDSGPTKVFVNGAKIQADEGSYSELRRTVLTGFIARLLMDEEKEYAFEKKKNSVKVLMGSFLDPDYESSAKTTEVLRELDVIVSNNNMSAGGTKAITKPNKYLDVIKNAFDHQDGIKALQKDGAWIVDLSAHKLGQAKVFMSTPSSSSSSEPSSSAAASASLSSEPGSASTSASSETLTTTTGMDTPLPIIQALVSLVSHFSEHECHRYIWVVPESRRLFVEQVLYLAKTIFPEIDFGRQSRPKRTRISSSREDENKDSSGLSASRSESEPASELESWTRAIELIYFGPANGMDICKTERKDGHDPEGSMSLADYSSRRMRDIVKENRGRPQNESEGTYEDNNDDGDEQGKSDRVLLGETELSRMATILSTSALAVASAGSRRLRKLNVDMNRILDGKGNSGVFLQYVLSRLCGIERKSNTRLNPAADLTLLEPYAEALNLTLVIAEWYDIIPALEDQLDPYVLVSYLFNLAAEVGHANRVLRVKDMDSTVAEARWFLFWAAKKVLEQGLQLLGLQSMEHM